jgi:hypothetical protein
MFRIIRSKRKVNCSWIEDPNEIIANDLCNENREANMKLRNKNREYLKDKTSDRERNRKNKKTRDMYRGINES